MTPPRTLCTALALVLAAGAAQAQSGGRALAPGVTVDVAPAPGSGATPAPGRIDDTALRHYARIGDVERMEAEIARLRALDPAWEPPKDLFSPQPLTPGVDETPFWQRLSAGKLAETRAAIAEQRRQTPSWQPSPKLLQELDTAEDSARIRQAGDAKRWQEIVDVATARPEAIACNRLDNAWRLAEAYGELKQADRAFDTYRTIVSQCPKAQERRDTIFKASRYLSPAQIHDLTALGASANPAAGEDYAAVRGVEAELEAGRLLDRVASGKGGPVSPADLARLGDGIRERRDADGALALGWYHQKRRQHQEAQSWFAAANEWQPSDRAAEGLILAYAGLGQRQPALDAAQPWRGRSSRVDRALLAVEKPVARGGGGTPRPQAPQGPSELEQALARRDYAGCLTAIDRAKVKGGWTAALAQQRGWCLLELKRPSEAEAAFAEAEALRAKGEARGAGKGSPDPAAAAKDAEEEAYGRAVARLAAGDTVGLARDLPTSGLSAHHKAEIRASLLATEASRAIEDKRYRDVLRLLDARKEIEPEPRDLGLLRGWALYNLKRLPEAHAVFKSIDDRLSTEASREGLTITGKTIYHDW